MSVQAFDRSVSRRRARGGARWTFGSVACAIALGIPSVAAAQQNANCPPGSWFCESASASGSATTAPAANGQLQQLPPADAKPAAAAGGAPAAGTPPVVIYQPGPPVVVVQGKPADKPAPYPYTARDPDARPKREWGLNLHIAGAMIGEGKHSDAGMGGIGLGLRFRPHPVVAIEPSIDFYGGRDYNGDRRGETSFQINTLLFATPRAKVVQLYFPIGFGWSSAHVQHDNVTPLTTSGTYVPNSYYERESTYGYFGMSAGIGLEFRVARHFALNTDLRGFIRGRTDSAADSHPEFTDGYRSTNTSGGGLFTGGMTFYF